MNDNGKQCFEQEDYDVIGSVMRLSRIIRRRSYKKNEHHRGRGRGRSHGHHRGRHGGFSRRRLLAVIAENEGATLGTLAEIIDIRPSSLTYALNKLENENLIIRKRAEEDSRIVHISITDSGKEIISAEADEENQERLHVTSILTKEERQIFYDCCQKLIKALGERDGD